MPGASVAEGFDNKSKGLMGGVDISFSGAPSNANQWRVDGANNNDIGSQRTILMYPSIDGIEEFKILRNSYGPEYGGAGGAHHLCKVSVLPAVSAVALTEAADLSPCRRGQGKRQRPEQLIVGAWDNVAVARCRPRRVRVDQVLESHRVAIHVMRWW